MNREEKIKIMQDVFWNHHNRVMGIGDQVCNKILDAINPPEIEVGMWGRFWDDENNDVGYGKLAAIEDGFYWLGEKDYYQFSPIPGLKEAIEKLEKE